MIEKIKPIPVCYLAHPVAANGIDSVADNLHLARQWLRYLIDTCPDIAFCCPWLPYCDVLDDYTAEHRERGLRDAIAMSRKCDGIVLCGGRISSGMRQELDWAKARGAWVVDLTAYGKWPPSVFAEISARWA